MLLVYYYLFLDVNTVFGWTG